MPKIRTRRLKFKYIVIDFLLFRLDSDKTVDYRNKQTTLQYDRISMIYFVHLFVS